MIRERNPKWSLKEAKLFIEGFIDGGIYAVKVVEERI